MEHSAKGEIEADGTTKQQNQKKKMES